MTCPRSNVHALVLAAAAAFLLSAAQGCGGKGIKFEIQPGDTTAARLAELSENQTDSTPVKELPGITGDEMEALGDSLLGNGKFFQAYVQYQKSLQSKPGTPRIGYKMGLTLLLANKNDDAVEQFQSVLKQDGSFAAAYEGIGWAYFNTQDYDRAEPALRRALQLNHRLWRSYNFLGNICDYRKQYDQAALEYASAIAVAPDKGFLYNNIGMSFTLAGRYREAAEAFNKAIEKRYREAKVYNNLGLALANLGLYEEALDAMKHGGSEGQAYNNLGCIYMDKGAYVEAVRCFERAIALEPSFYAKANENLKKARLLAAKQ